MSAFEQQYGSLSYTDGLPDYYGLPLEQINKTYDVLNQKYELNTKKWSALRQNIANSAILKSETQSIDKALSNANKTMSDITRTGNFHLADITVDDALYQFTTDKDMKAAFEKKANKEVYYKNLDDLVKNKNITSNTATLIQAEWESVNAGYTHHDETGRLVNGVKNRTIADEFDFNEKFNKYFANINPSDTNTIQAATTIKKAMASGAYANFGEYYKFLSEQKGVTGNRTLELMQGIINEPRAQAYLKQTAELNIMQNFGVKDSNSGLYKTTPNREIELRQLNLKEFEDQGFVVGNNKIVAVQLKRNNKGEFINDAGVVTTKELAGKIPMAEYDIDSNNLQKSLYTVVLAQEYSTMQGTAKSFALAHQYVQSKWQFERSSQYEVNAERGKRMLDVVPVYENKSLANKEGATFIKDKKEELTYRTEQIKTNLREQIKTLTGMDIGNDPKVINTFLSKLDSYKQYKDDDNIKGRAYRTAIQSIEQLQQNEDSYNSFLLDGINEYSSIAQGEHGDISRAFKVTAEKLVAKGAPIDFLGDDGNLNSSAMAYCYKHNRVPNVQNFVSLTGITGNDWQNARNAQPILKDYKYVKASYTRPVYQEVNINFADVKSKPLQTATNSLLARAIDDPSSFGTITASTGGSKGFSKGNTTSVQGLMNHLSTKYNLGKFTFNKDIKTFVESGETGSKLFTVGNGAKIQITKPDGISTSGGKNYADVNINVIDKSNNVLEANTVSWSVGTGKTNNIQSSAFKSLEDPAYLGRNMAKGIVVGDEIKSGTPKVIDNEYINEWRYIPNQGLYVPVSIANSKGIPTKNFDKTSIGEVPAILITDEESIQEAIYRIENK